VEWRREAGVGCGKSLSRLLLLGTRAAGSGWERGKVAFVGIGPWVSFRTAMAVAWGRERLGARDWESNREIPRGGLHNTVPFA
jgi:hypothetical protein